MPANSRGCPARPNGVSAPKLFTFSGGMVEGINGVQIGPGATAFTRMPLPPSIWAKPAVKLETAPFVAPPTLGKAAKARNDETVSRKKARDEIRPTNATKFPVVG